MPKENFLILNEIKTNVWEVFFFLESNVRVGKFFRTWLVSSGSFHWTQAKPLFLGESHILVHTFSGYFHFSPYILFFSAFSLYPEKCFSFWSLPLHQKWRKLTWQMARINNTKLMSMWFKLIIKNVFLELINAMSESKLKKIILLILTK